MKRISAARVSRLITGWQAGGPSGERRSLAERLCLALGKLIAARELPVGALMPSERTLAEALVVSRGTVVAAYVLLRDARFVSSQQGSGYRIIASSNSPGEVHNRLVGEVVATPQDIDMSSGALQSSPTLVDLLSGLQGADLASMVTGLGYDAYGLPQLRSAVARYYTDLGLATGSDQILITSGAQQAVWLLANALVDSSDLVLVEDPSYRGSMEAFRRRNARLAATPVTSGGFDWQALERHLRQHPTLFYLFADGQNPTGRSLDQAARERLAALLARYPTFIVEDGSQCELGLQSDVPPQPLAALCDPERVATIGTLSKLFWGGLRVGWIRASTAVTARLASMKAVNDLGSSRFDQRIAVELFERLPEARVWRHGEIRNALRAAERIVREHGGADWQWHAPDGGTAMWIRIPGAHAVALCQAAARQGLLISSGPAYSVTEGFGDCIRLPFVRPESMLVYTVELIAGLLARQSAVAGDGHAPPVPPEALRGKD
ncbi:aminotransferase-like domain-containing protein [Diaphorobacter caeni]|uniref:aminotransferase-like domain-containing protein n=1 Tax=Diaphorobacter caeni TaxID=2784387 RepID=UPI001890B3D5|nr:PLP-dependent aminotransferase family protein [Diaphorobacter caeni]MBF5003339.1 PLP-dependent aminotransferase family protein [Diaphorobacter caeni]